MKMMSNITQYGTYIGDEFPDDYGKPIEIKDSDSDYLTPSYAIRFFGESEWWDNMQDEDIRFD